MTRTATRANDVVVPRSRVRVIAVALILSGLGLTGCSVVSAVRKITHAVESNKSTVDSFSNKIQAGEATAFEATYVTTGSSPTTTTYAVEPPKGLLFRNSPTANSANNGIGSLDIVVNSSGEYSCTASASGSVTTCEKLPPVNAAAENNIFGFYTAAHWVNFLKGFSLVAGLAGDSVSSSTMSVNGFNMQCVDFRASGVPGTSTICTTSQGILGYVKVASNTTTFEIKSYSASPPASLFELPPGATVTTLPTGTT
jgi:hypothetical protein